MPWAISRAGARLGSGRSSAGLAAAGSRGSRMTGGRSAGGYLLEFVHNAVVVAFGGQTGCHGPGGGAVAGIPDDPADGRPERFGAGVLPQPDARAGIHHPGGVVGLVAT